MIRYKEEIIEKYMDEYGIVVMGDGNGGDGLSKTGFFYYLCYLYDILDFRDVENFKKVLEEVQLEKGHFTRHVKEPWHTQWSVSRDQYLDMWAGMEAMFFSLEIRQHFYDSVRWIKKHFFRISKDILGPHHFGFLFRIMRHWWIYPLIWLTDIVLLINTLIVSNKPVNDTSAKIHNWVFLLQSERHWSTLFSL